jgi:nucleoside-diphosphate-sugar epimerase
MIYASSGVVYGDADLGPFRVDSAVVDSDMYSHLKLSNEQVVLDAGGTVARISNLFGRGMAKTNVVSDIIGQIPGIGPMRIRDDRPVRDFLHVSDAAVALGRLIGGAHHGILNVGSGIGTSVRTLAEFALAAAGQGGREIISTAPASGSSTNVLEIAETTRALGWSPSRSLREWIFQLINDRACPSL